MIQTLVRGGRALVTLALVVAASLACGPAPVTSPSPTVSRSPTPAATLALGPDEGWYGFGDRHFAFSSTPEVLWRAEKTMLDIDNSLHRAGIGPVLEVTVTISFGDPKTADPAIKVTASGEQATADAIYGGVTKFDRGELSAWVRTGPGKPNQRGVERALPPYVSPSIVVPVALSVRSTELSSSGQLSTTDVVMTWKTAAPDHWEIRVGASSRVLKATERSSLTYVLLTTSEASRLRLIAKSASSLLVDLQDLPPGYSNHFNPDEPIRPVGLEKQFSFHTLGGNATREVDRIADSAILAISVVVLYSPALASAYLLNLRIASVAQGEYREVSGPGIGDESADFIATKQTPGTTATYALARYGNVVTYGLAVTPRSNEVMPLRPLFTAQLEKLKSEALTPRAANLAPYQMRFTY